MNVNVRDVQDQIKPLILSGTAGRGAERTVRSGARTVGMSERFVIPNDLAQAAASEGRDDWLTELPALVARIAADWQIEVGDPSCPGA
jgi:hypothetical protein